MRKLLIILFLLIFSFAIKAQQVVTVQNQSFVYGSSDTQGYNAQQTVPTTFTFMNNSLQSATINMYMLQAGTDNDVDNGTYDMLDGEVITGNKFTWVGTVVDNQLVHGCMVHNNINALVKYNKFINMPSGIICKSLGNTYTSNGWAYNVFQGDALVCCYLLGINNVPIYNNTFYNTSPTFTNSLVRGTWRGIVHVYYNSQTTHPGYPTTNIKIKNNIFYTKYQIYNIVVNGSDDYSGTSPSGCLTGFESDYNIFYCEAGTPMFQYMGVPKDFAAWQALGYDTHSVVVNPNFNNFTDLVPTIRLNYGTDLGTTWNTGLSPTNTWVVGNSPSCNIQNGTWQVGAHVYSSGNTYYVSTTGNNSNSGTISSPWATPDYGMNHIAAGDILYVRGGTYTPTGYTSNGNQCAVAVSGKNGTSSNYYQVYAYPGEFPIIDGTNLTSTSYNRIGIGIFNSSYWHIKGIEIKNCNQAASSPHYGGQGVYIESCNHINIENCNAHNNGGPGMGQRVSSEIDFINCDSHDNYDPYTALPGDSADGFDIGFGSSEGVIRLTGCRAWNNSDDGYDMYQDPNYSAIYILTNCWAWHQGYRSDQTTTGGDGNGFKLGADPQSYTGVTKRTMINCLSYNNRMVGISQQSADVKMVLYNNISYLNGIQGYEFQYFACADILKNNISYNNGSTNIFQTSTQTADHNSWQVATVTDADFASVTSSSLTSARQSNGNLPVITFLHLATGSDLIHTGVAVSGLTTDCDGVTYANPPSLGPFEYVPGGPTIPTVTTTAITSITTTTASSGGNISSDGGASVTARGVCWNTSANPTTANSKTTNGTGTGSYTSSITGLTSNTTYHVRAYATNSIGTAYGADVQFTTAASITTPTVTTTAITNITNITASSGGTISSNGGGTITAAGVCWSTSTTPTTANSKTTDSYGTTPYTSTLTGLSSVTTYYVRAYATNSAGTGYGSQTSFVTLTIPTTHEIQRIRSRGKILIVTQ